MRKPLLILFLQAPIIIFGQVPSNDKNWDSTPVLNESFTGTRSWNDDRVDNTNTWIAYFSESGVIHDSTDANCGHHYCHSIFQRENAIFSTGTPGYMILRAEYKPNTTNYWYPWYAPVSCPYDYISGVIETIMSFRYGYFEIRCALPPANWGNATAFWLWSGINRYNEIDIFEHFDNNIPISNRKFTGGYYTSDAKPKNRVTYNVPLSEPGLTSFHTYAIEWSPKVIIWYFDGKEVGQALNEPEITDQPMRLKVNYTLDDHVENANHNTDLFPLDMKIDYVRVSTLKCNCGNTTTITNSAQLNAYDHSVKKKITIANSVSTIKVNSENSVSLRATDEVIINGNFEVPIGAEFYATTHGCPQ